MVQEVMCSDCCHRVDIVAEKLHFHLVLTTPYFNKSVSKAEVCFRKI
jgi:hypothetical protein